MSWFTNSHIDPSTGRNKRDKSPDRTRDQGRGGGVPRSNGKPADRTEWRRQENVKTLLRRRGR